MMASTRGSAAASEGCSRGKEAGNVGRAGASDEEALLLLL